MVTIVERPLVDRPIIERLQQSWETPRGWRGTLSTVDHKTIGIRYLVTAIFFLVVGGIEALVIRTQLAVANEHLVSPGWYNQLFSMHGVTMIFLYAAPVLSGFSNYLWPLMLGSRDMAYPRLNALSYWIYLVSGIFLYTSLPLGAMPNAGWFDYVPYAARQYNPGLNIDFYCLALLLLAVSTTVGSVNFITTLFKTRAPGMSLNRVPIIVWGTLTASISNLFALPSLSAALVMLFLDRHVGTLLPPAAGGLHLRRAGHDLHGPHRLRRVGAPHVRRGHPDHGARLLRRGQHLHHHPERGGRVLVAGDVLVRAPVVPGGDEVHARLHRAVRHRRREWRDDGRGALGLAAHRHVLRGGAPALRARRHQPLPGDRRRLLLVPQVHRAAPGRAARLVEFLDDVRRGEPAVLPHAHRRAPGDAAAHLHLPRGLGWDVYNSLETAGAFLFAFGVLLFLVNVWRSRTHGAVAGANPWDAPTLEWSVPSPPPPYNFAILPRIGSRHPLWERRLQEGSQHSVLDRGPVLAEGRETFATSPLDSDPAAVMRMPEDSYYPVLLATSLGLIAYGLVFAQWWLAVIGVVGTAASAIGWLAPTAATAYLGVEATEYGELPVGASGRRSVGWWGMAAVIATEGSFFVYLLFSYFYLASVSTNPWPTEVPGFWLPLVNTGILVASSGVVWWAQRGIKAGQPGRLRLGLVVAIALGVLFLVLQGVEYSHEQLSATRTADGSLFYTITGFHGAHVAVGLLMLSVVLVRAIRGNFTARQHEAVSNVTMYWHFVDVVWLAVFTSLYVTPHLR